MRVNITILLLISIFLSACGKHKRPQYEDSTTVIPNTNSGVSSRPIVLEPIQRSPSDDSSANASHTETLSAPESVSNQTIKSTPDILTTQTIADTDLLDRIRRGFSLPNINSHHTAQYIEWSIKHPSYLHDLLTRATPFLYYIVEEIEKRGMPTEIALLPAIESAYKPGALSTSKASGLWQFVSSTAGDFGLNQDWWYDARRDPIESTKAALDYLSQLNELFDGDWHLTLAAYNAGQGTILRAISSNKSKGLSTRYQDLSLRSETVRYVPKLQAIKNIINNPNQYGVNLISVPNRPHFEVVKIPGQIDLDEFAQLSQIDMDEIQHLNAGHLRWATAPNGPHRLLLPLSNHAKTAIAISQIKAKPRVEYQQYTVARGDTLSQIARRYQVSVDSIKMANKIHNSNIRTGATLTIPVANASRRERTSNNLYEADSKTIHRVVKGDTLWSIAKRYRVKVQELLSWNQLTVGQILKLDQALLILAR